MLGLSETNWEVSKYARVNEYVFFPHRVKVDNFGVSVAILLRSANSGETSIKCHDPAYYFKTTAANNLEGLYHEIRGQISFPKFIFRREFLYLSVAWRFGNEKKHCHKVSGCKNQGGNCPEFPKSRQNLHCPKSSNQSRHCLDFHVF